jgi:hypothetical protein
MIVDCAGNQVNVNMLNKDIAFGTSLEQKVIDILADYFQEPVEKTKYRYSPYDAVSPSAKYEIKSRRNRHDQYDTTIVPVDKTTRVTEDRLIFVFHFTDGLYYIVFSEEQFKDYEVRDVTAIRSGGVRTSKPHFFIPVKDLKRIDI